MFINNLEIKQATSNDVYLILSFIKELAVYEKMQDEVVATEELLTKNLFGEHKIAEVVIGYFENQPVGFALFFHNFSTFLGKPGIYLEDLFVKPTYRGNGFGKAFLIYLARIAKERDCGRLEWNVLDWNEPAIKFYKSLDAKPLREWLGFRLAGNALIKLARE
jgi:GNAT superfamily N-acetyltransferase